MKFITLTFAKEVKELETANKIFKNFLKKLKRFLGFQPQYIAVIEFQTSGRVHFHVLMNTPYIRNSLLYELWGQGFVRINSYSDLTVIRNLGLYVSKYLRKGTIDNRLVGKKAYQCSKGLKRPLEITDNVQVDMMLKVVDKSKIIYDLEFDNEYCGLVKYKQYKF